MYIDVSSYKGGKRVRIIERQKINGRWSNRLVKHIGTARDDEELAILRKIAQTDRVMLSSPNQLELDLGQNSIRGLFSLGIFHHGAELILGDIFDSLGISLGRLTPLLRLLTIARIIHPASKRDTASWLQDTLSSSYSLDQIYRFLDVIYTHRSQIQTSLRKAVADSYSSSMSYLLYDVTTLHFEIDHEDQDLSGWAGLRKRGYSKNHRSDLPQIVLGLCVNELGMPLSYRIYPGNTYEGRTLIDGVEFARKQIGADEITVVADAGMLSSSNISLIEDMGMGFIISARIKNLDDRITKQIFSHNFEQNPICDLSYKGNRLIVSYSQKRARADAKRRQASIVRLEKLISQNRALRKHQFLEFEVEDKPRLNSKAIEKAALFDGLKGYLTNNQDLSAEAVISHYKFLPIVEQSFRLTKSDLKIRPSFHQRARRIEAHVILCMISLCVMRILEDKVRTCGFTYLQALSVISKTNSALIGNERKTHLIPPLYSPEFNAILKAVRD